LFPLVIAARERGVSEPWKVYFMTISRCNFIFSLLLLLAVSGCSGSRLRNAFRAEREFFTLSELEEYNASQDDIRQQPKHWIEGLASFSDESADEEATRSKRQGLLNFGRLLGRDDESIPPDPFVVADEDTESSQEGREAASDRAVVSVSSSGELPTEHAMPLVVDDWVTEMGVSAAATDSRESSEQSEANPSFSDIMAEFSDDQEETDDLDSLADQLMADQLMAEHSSKSGSLDEMLADFSESSSVAGEVDRFEVSPEMFLRDASASAESIPVVSAPDEDIDNPFDAGRRPVQIKDPVPNLPDNVGESSAFDVGQRASSNAVPGESGIQTVEATEAQNRRHGLADILDSDTTGAGSLWKQSSQATGRVPEPVTHRVNRRPEIGNHHQAAPAWDAASSSQSVTSFEQIHRPEQSQDKMSFASSPLLLPGMKPSVQSQAGTLAPVRMNPPITTGPNQDPFLNDFEKLVQATRISSPVATGSSDAVIAGFSPRMWVVLLGTVVILYLLFAPERQNRSEPSNR
jgi:hypothetical protein